MKTIGLAAPVAVAIALGAVGCGGSGPNRGAYVRANETLFHQLPVFPVAQLSKEVSSPIRKEEDGPVVGYTTLFDFKLPRSARPAEVASFYTHALEPKWHLVEKLNGPVLNFSKGPESVSINLESWRAHVLEVAVDHGR